MSWTKADIEPSEIEWTNGVAPDAACDLAANETLVFNERNHVLDTGHEGSLSGWASVSMGSVCDG